MQVQFTQTPEAISVLQERRDTTIALRTLDVREPKQMMAVGVIWRSPRPVCECCGVRTDVLYNDMSDFEGMRVCGKCADRHGLEVS